MITYPPEMLPKAEEDDNATVYVLSDRANELLAQMPLTIWTESEDGQICLQMARDGLCTYTRWNATLGRFEPL